MQKKIEEKTKNMKEKEILAKILQMLFNDNLLTIEEEQEAQRLLMARE